MSEQPVQFVILEHDHPFVHWDFMFEQGDSLRTWRLLRAPVLEEWIEAEQLPNHRRQYLDYEGPVSGGRGKVTRWDFGTCIVREQRDGQIRLTLSGSRFEAEALLECVLPEEDEWRFRLSRVI